MAEPVLENATPFAVAPLFLADEDLRPLFVAVVKATYTIGEGGLALAEEQAPVSLAGEPFGDPEKSSYRYEPECAFAKPATDVALVGSACAPRPGTTDMLVAFQVGPLRAGVRVVGDRVFFKGVGSVGMTRPLAFEKIPLQWERAFGGWDRSHPDPAKHAFEPRNPVGTGFRASGSRFEEGLRPPNLEDPARPFKGWGDRVAPAGVGFTSPDWEPRRHLAGTYGKAWEEQRAPALPKDFDRRFLNAAAPGLVAPGFLRGDEAVVVSGTTPRGGVSFRLPGLPPPRVSVTRNGQPDADLEMKLDTVIVDTDAARAFLIWRGNVSLRDPTGVETVRVESEAPARPAVA
jgi:hypothetical protein